MRGGRSSLNRTRWAGPAGALLIGLLSGCALPQDEEPAPFGEDDITFGEFGEEWQRPAPRRTWLDVRIEEFLEAFTLRVSLGPGLGARAAATKLVQAGLLVQGPSEPFGEVLRLDTVHFGNSGARVGAWDVHSVEYGLSAFYSYEEDVFGYFDPSLEWAGSYQERSAAAFEAGLHLGLIGGVAGVDPLAVGRFLGGLLGFGEKGWFDDDEAPDQDDSDSEFDWDSFEVSSAR